MKIKRFSQNEIEKLTSSLTPEKAMQIAKAVIESCTKSENHSAAFVMHNDMSRADGLPCLVSVNTPFGCICIAPPGADC